MYVSANARGCADKYIAMMAARMRPMRAALGIPGVTTRRPACGRNGILECEAGCSAGRDASGSVPGTAMVEMALE